MMVAFAAICFGANGQKAMSTAINGLPIGAPVDGLPGATWADANNDNRIDGYIYKSHYFSGRPLIGLLGLTIVPLTPAYALEAGLPESSTGVLVGAVEPGSAADRASLYAGVVLLSVNQLPISTDTLVRQAIKALESRRPMLLLAKPPAGPHTFLLIESQQPLFTGMANVKDIGNGEREEEELLRDALEAALAEARSASARRQ